ncbi:MAG: class I SAM-dependent methyltransferase [Planctomycetota bacterium]|jgi:ubiquinone/menaquinone biosynthesis C-methylase UbiE
MKLKTTGAQKYFDSVPKQWDALYSHENRLMYLINQWLRKGLYERYRLTFEHCGDLSGAKVLDIGCGTGRYSIECAKRGAAKVVGIDFAPSMIEFSRKLAREMNVFDKCDFIHDDFMEHTFEDSFDIVLALGVFDYVEKPEPIFKKIARLNPRKFLATFPKHTAIWGIQRKIRYNWLKKCPIYYYTAEQLNELSREAPFRHYQVIPVKRGHFLATGT